MPTLPNYLNQSLGSPVTSRTISWLQMAQGAWGSECNTPDPGAYAFSNGRKFDSTDIGNTGFYAGGDINA